MRLVFFDETKNDQQYPSYHIGAVVIEDTHLLEVEGIVNALATDVFGNAHLSQDTEFHAAEIYHRKKNFKDWGSFDLRIDVLRRLVGILSLDFVHLIDIQINCDLLTENQSAEDIAFMFLCERSNDFMRKHKDLGMLIGDRESDKGAARHAGSLSHYKAKGTGFAFGREIRNLVDSVHFTHSHLSRFLQLADVYVWLQQFRVRNRGSTNPRHQAVLSLLKEENVNLFASKYKEWPKRD